MIFKDISNFNNVDDYLPILNGCINSDLIVILLLYHGVFKSNTLQKWYKNYHLNAVLADVLILVIGIILARFFYKFFFTKFNIWKFTALAISIQIIHDFAFYWFFKSVPLGYNAMLDFFKEYSKEVGIGAILGDSFMMFLACLMSSNFATLSVNYNIIILIISLYLYPYMLNYI